MELSRKIAAEITKYAAEYQAGVIVFEYPDIFPCISRYSNTITPA